MKKYLKTGVSLIGTNVMIGAIPNLSGTASETTLKTNFAEGMEHMGKALPVMGKVKGTKMVLNSLNKLKPIKIKKGIRL